MKMTSFMSVDEEEEEGDDAGASGVGVGAKAEVSNPMTTRGMDDPEEG